MNRGHPNQSSDMTPTPHMSAAPYPNGSTGHSVFYPPPQGYDQFSAPSHPRHPHMNMTTDHMGRPTYHETPQGRMALPMQGGSQVVMMNQTRYTPSPAMTDEGMFEPMDEGPPQLALDANSPSHHYTQLRPHHHHPVISPTDEMRFHQQHQQLYQQQMQQHQMQMDRPPMMQRHSIANVQPSHRPTMQRHQSLQVPAVRSASPQIVNDIFDAPSNGSPVRRSNSALGIEIAPPSMPDPLQDMYFGNQTQGITPSRALGPAPHQPFNFNSFNRDPALTPSGRRGADPVSANTAITASSSSSDLTDATSARISDGRRSYRATSEENDSPSKVPAVVTRPKGKTQHDSSSSSLELDLAPSRSKPAGCRTSAKFAEVAPDPGVEGLPEGYVASMERPSPSFACIIGQAILASKAGGLSLEHIYRYVETAYPFFQVGDGAWRNSVRHNLSIHKMFETIPRTPHFPPGKGGIWIIHDDEKCHWPSPDKFVKNFPANHPHHHNCRQTLHEAEKERQAKEKAEREGRVYIPKKVKKVKKGSVKQEEESVEMTRSLSTQSDGLFAPSTSSQGRAPRTITPQQMHIPLPPYDSSDIDSADHSTLSQMPPPQVPSCDDLATLALSSTASMAPPPRFSLKADKRRYEDDGDLFGSSVKKLRVPLHPIDGDTQQFINGTFITPERDRAVQHSSTNKMAQSSTIKTPALVNSSSSPGSSPMPPTVPRTTHHPSALHQGWTHDDMESSPAPPPLGAAFDFEIKPKATRKPVAEDDFVPMGPPPSGLPPKTPVTRSSAHQKPQTPHEKPQTPQDGFLTPYYTDSPGIPPRSMDLLSTPAWEMRGCIDRLMEGGATESPDGTRDIVRYSLAASGPSNGASPQKRQAA